MGTGRGRGAGRVKWLSTAVSNGTHCLNILAAHQQWLSSKQEALLDLLGPYSHHSQSVCQPIALVMSNLSGLSKLYTSCNKTLFMVIIHFKYIGLSTC